MAKYWTGLNPQEEAAEAFEILSHDAFAADPTNYNRPGFNKNLVLDIEHIPSNQLVKFKALIKEFSDTFESLWNSEPVYGRMDPIETFQGTKRVIKLSWDVVSFDVVEARKNLKEVDRLASFLYPTYDTVHGGATTITSSPLLRMKFGNLVTQPNKDEGLVGRMDGFSYTPDFDSGVFIPAPGEAHAGKLFPQTITVSCTFYVLHTHKLGWRKFAGRDDLSTQAGFPHNVVPGVDAYVGPPATSAVAAAMVSEVAAPVAGEADPSRPVIEMDEIDIIGVSSPSSDASPEIPIDPIGPVTGVQPGIPIDADAPLEP